MTSFKILDISLKIRALEKKLLDAYSKRLFGGTVHTCIGQELLPVLIAEFAQKESFIFSNHRGHGHYIAHTQDYSGLFREFLAKKLAPSGGIGGSQHLYNSNFMSNGIQGNTAPFAVGVGLQKPTIIYVGDGTFGEGALYEALNLASYLNSNILFVVEDNGISQTTPSRIVLPGDLRSKFDSFDIPVLEADSADYKSLYSTVKSCFPISHGPKALIVQSYRLYSHSKGDDTRQIEAINNLPDPLRNLAELDGVDFEKLLAQADLQIDQIFSSVQDEEDDLFYIGKTLANSNLSWRPFSPSGSQYRVNESIRNSIELVLKDGGIFIGEDVITKWNDTDNPYGGAFGVALGLSENYDNVIGTSISEAGIVGVSAGRAFASSKLSVCEIMFADFATLIVDQVVNGIDKFHKMFSKSLAIPLAIRVPYGMGRGYGPTHSQTPFEIFSGVSEVSIISHNPLINYNEIFEKIQNLGKSALIFEPKIFYGDRICEWEDLLLGFTAQITSDDLIAPSVRIQTDSRAQVRVITHGSASKAVLKYLKTSSLKLDVLVVSEISNKSSFNDWLLESEVPLVILEEKNIEVGYLTSRVCYELQRSGKSTAVFCNAPVTNIPANAKWEQNLMLDKKKIEDLIMEALI